MVTTFNKKDLVKFGEYLLSEQREQSLKQANAEDPNMIPYEERFRHVYDADVRNWIAMQDEFKYVSAVGQMCLESLDPQEFEAWETVRAGLMRNRSALQIK